MQGGNNELKGKFLTLLRELFRFDCADLDFGIYRIMNYKRGVIEKFIEEDLPKDIEEALQKGALASQQEVQEKLAQAQQKVKETLGEKALDADGNLAPDYADTPVGREYLEAQKKAAGTRRAEQLEAAVYNHLYTFFSRYWQDGDFIPKRRYSKKERYAVPYNGEEVYLYWANRDQYYVKTAEYFTDYGYKAPNGVMVRFKLRSADVEQNNVKGDKRFFIPLPDDISWNESTKELLVPFHYRPLNEKETALYGTKDQQEKIIAESLIEIPKRVEKTPDAWAALTQERRKDAAGRSVSYLEHHLRQYTRRNTADFFIHKDLKGFLSRELDFYLKNEVLNLDELEAAGEERAEGWFELMRTIKRVGTCIIEFLAQIEEFQKMLWEKRKFVTETFYCVTVGNVPESFYPEIADCEAQWEEWKLLYCIDTLPKDLLSGDVGTRQGRIDFLKAHPTLVVDTRHFCEEFVDRLLAAYDDLDGLTDGLLIHSENWQALNLLLEKYRERVKQIHIDPPYNTDASGFLYKNDYRHSSWLSMMMQRVTASVALMREEGTLTCHIDENEFERLRMLCEEVFGYVGTAVWDKLNPMMGAQELAVQHEYILFCASRARAFKVRAENVKRILEAAGDIVRRHGGVTEPARTEFAEWVKQAPGLTGGEKAYQYLDADGRVYRLVAMTWPNPSPPPAEFFLPLLHPVTGKPCPVPSRGWSLSPRTMAELLARNEIVFGPDESTQPQRKVYLSCVKALASVIRNGSRGKSEIEDLGLDFTYNHPVTLYTTLLDAGLGSEPAEDVVLDFFAGSGTTGHAVINLNREDGGRRKFILVEMADYFDTVLLPRIKKVTFSPEWKDGSPKRTATPEEAERSPRIVKCVRLESYEDSLNNIAFDESADQRAMRFEDYLLSYMLKWETRKSETLLDPAKLEKPFCYRLHTYQKGESRVLPVDLPETFNYLIGLDVKTRKVLYDDGRRYVVYRGTTRDGTDTAVIWREMDGWTEEHYRRDREFVKECEILSGADKIYVNGDSAIPGACSLDGTFKSLMFAPVEG